MIVLPMTEVFPGVSSVMFPDAMLMAAPPQPKTVFLRQERHCVLKFAFLMCIPSLSWQMIGVFLGENGAKEGAFVAPRGGVVGARERQACLPGVSDDAVVHGNVLARADQHRNITAGGDRHVFEAVVVGAVQGDDVGDQAHDNVRGCAHHSFLRFPYVFPEPVLVN